MVGCEEVNSESMRTRLAVCNGLTYRGTSPLTHRQSAIYYAGPRSMYDQACLYEPRFPNRETRVIEISEPEYRFTNRLT